MTMSRTRWSSLSARANSALWTRCSRLRIYTWKAAVARTGQWHTGGSPRRRTRARRRRCARWHTCRRRGWWAMRHRPRPSSCTSAQEVADSDEE